MKNGKNSRMYCISTGAIIMRYGVIRNNWFYTVSGSYIIGKDAFSSKGKAIAMLEKRAYIARLEKPQTPQSLKQASNIIRKSVGESIFSACVGLCALYRRHAIITTPKKRNAADMAQRKLITHHHTGKGR